MAYSSITKPSDYFNTVIYSGNGVDNRDITGLDFQPDMLWSKIRNGADNHSIYDIVRGDTKELRTQTNAAEVVRTDNIQALNSDGFQVGTDGQVNGSSGTYVSWGWSGGGTASDNTDGSITSSASVNTTAGFSVITYTGTGSSATVGHGLGVAPKVTIFKRRDSTNSWRTQTTVIDGSLDNLYLNLTDAKVNASNSAPTSSVLNLDTGTEVNASSGTYVAYNFAEIKGYSKFGSYEGNGNGDGTFIYTGFKPAWLMIKNADSTNNWSIKDNKRNTYNPELAQLLANSSNAESDDAGLDFLSNGFKLRGTSGNINTNANTYIYMAFAEQPLVANVSGGLPTTAR